MASHTAPEAPVQDEEPSIPGRPNWVGPLFTALVVLIGVIVMAQVFGHQGDVKDLKAIGQFSNTAALLGSLVPVLAAATVAWIIPEKKHTWHTRLPLAVIAAVFAVFIARMWPTLAAPAAEAAEPGAPSAEIPTLLS